MVNKGYIPWYLIKGGISSSQLKEMQKEEILIDLVAEVFLKKINQ